MYTYYRNYSNLKLYKIDNKGKQKNVHDDVEDVNCGQHKKHVVTQ